MSAYNHAMVIKMPTKTFATYTYVLRKYVGFNHTVQ